MRGTVSILITAWLMPLAAVAQEWRPYAYPDAGFAIQLPVPPVVEKGSFKTPAGVALPMTRYVARADGIVYSLEVVDFSGVNADGANIIGETEKSLGASGQVTVAVDARINREFGRELGVTGADGSRSTIAIFFVSRHLYTLIGRSLPPNAIARSGDANRFQQSLQFIGDNGGTVGFGGFGGRGRFRGGFNTQAVTACTGKSAGDVVQLDTPGGSVPATCTLVARPNAPPSPSGTQNGDGLQNRTPSP
jgi:hypothetical protein